MTAAASNEGREIGGASEPRHFTEFDYLLNAMERAAQHERPAELQYGAKRRCLFDYVRDLERRATPPVKGAGAAAEPGQWQKIETLVKQIHEATKRGERTQDHGLIGNLRCILDHVLPEPPDMLAASRDRTDQGLQSGEKAAGQDEPFDHAHPDSWKYEAKSEGVAPVPLSEPVLRARIVEQMRFALAWGNVYGPILVPEQWEEMRETMAKQFADAAIDTARAAPEEPGSGR